MKLGRLIINGESFDENKSYSQGGITLPVYQINDVLDSAYGDISSIENWDTSILLDWSRRRDEIRILFNLIAGSDLSTYNDLTESQKLIGAKYFLVPKSLRIGNNTVTTEEDVINWGFLATETKKSRKDCIEAMRIKVSNLVRDEGASMAQTQQFFEDVALFINSFIESNNPKFKQWVTNEVGSSYETDGFEQTGYWSQQLEDELMEIYNGAY